MKTRGRHRRQSSVATSYAQEELPRDHPRRRSSQVTSWYIDNLDEDDETSCEPSRTRWGPIGEKSFRESLRSTSSRSPLSYHECNYFYY